MMSQDLKDSLLEWHLSCYKGPLVALGQWTLKVGSLFPIADKWRGAVRGADGVAAGWWKQLDCIQDHKLKETTQNPKCRSCVFSFPPHFFLLTAIFLFLFWDYQDAVGLGSQPHHLQHHCFQWSSFYLERVSQEAHKPPLSLLTLFSLGIPSRLLLSACQFSLPFLVKQEESGWRAEKKTLAFAFL